VTDIPSDLAPRTGACLCRRERLLYPLVLHITATFRGETAEHVAVEEWCCEACGKVAIEVWRGLPTERVIDTRERRERAGS
jgi:hypothetical protein